MIPDLIELGSPTPWAVLPPGIHPASLEEVRERFANTPHRRRLFQGVAAVAENLWAAGCTEIYIDGSFVTAKPHPDDFDGCWNPKGVSPSAVDPVLLDFTEKRKAQKQKFRGEMFMTIHRAKPAGPLYLDFQQIEKFSGRRKGIVLLLKPE